MGRTTNVLRLLVSAGFLALFGWGALEIRGALRTRDRELASRDERIGTLQAEVAQRESRIGELTREAEELREQSRKLAAALRLMRVDHRVARLSVIDQSPAPDGPGGVRTEVAFQELDAQGRPLGPEKRTTLAGKMAWVDALVIKFDDSYVEQGDALRGTSICFFRRLFGEFQWPAEGLPLDGAGSRPLPYAGDDADPGFESRLWARFWDYANDAELAARAGVRAVHGEAPSIELRAGRSYLLELRASGGLSLRPE